MKKIEQCGTMSGSPRQKVTITDCGVLDAENGPQVKKPVDSFLAGALSDISVDALPPKKPWYRIW